jgi:hypothetical protein
MPLISFSSHVAGGGGAGLRLRLEVVFERAIDEADESGFREVYGPIVLARMFFINGRCAERAARFQTAQARRRLKCLWKGILAGVKRAHSVVMTAEVRGWRG